MTGVALLGARAKEVSHKTAGYSGAKKTAVLNRMAELLMAEREEIQAANQKDLAAAAAAGLRPSLIDRLRLTEDRIAGMADSLRQIARFPEPIGEEIESFDRENGLHIRKVRVPMGAIGVIYEARPNVTTDVAGLCLKAGNAVLLRGGKEAFCSNEYLTGLLRRALCDCGGDADAVQLVTDLSHESAAEMMQLTDSLDLLIPRGGAGLIRRVVSESRVPVIQTGVGNCHVYVDETADFKMALEILVNAKVSRPSVCNACESLLVHKSVAEAFLPSACAALEKNGVTICGCAETRRIVPSVLLATEEDYGKEYLDLKISVRVVPSLTEAIAHINKYGTHHSEVIVTKSPENGRRFQNEVDSAAVYVNASTRFTDGGEFGFGGEIGISTQKLHARGPMGVLALTSYQYQIDGNGQIR